jgi:hypothetical protein
MNGISELLCASVADESDRFITSSSIEDDMPLPRYMCAVEEKPRTGAPDCGEGGSTAACRMILFAGPATVRLHAKGLAERAGVRSRWPVKAFGRICVRTVACAIGASSRGDDAAERKWRWVRKVLSLVSPYAWSNSMGVAYGTRILFALQIMMRTRALDHQP